MYAYEFTETRGESMLPTLSATNDYVHVLKNFQNGLDIKDTFSNDRILMSLSWKSPVFFLPLGIKDPHNTSAFFIIILWK